MTEGADPKYVPFCELFESGTWSFERLVEVAEAMTNENAGSLQSGWALLGADAQASISEFGQGLSTKLADAWTGDAAQSAAASIATYARSSEDAGGYFQGVSTTLWGIATAVDAVKNTQSGVPEYISKGGIYNTLTPWDTAAENAYHERHGQALQALTTFSFNLGRVDEHVPQFAPPESTLGADRPGFPGGGGGSGGSGGGGGGGGGGLTGGSVGPGPDGLPSLDSVGPAAGGGAAVPGVSELGDALAAGTAPAAASTAPAGLGPAGVSPAGVGGGLGGGGSAGGGGGGLGGGGLGGGAGGLAGGGLTGVPPSGVPAGSAGPGAAAGAGIGRPGMAGGAMGGMMGGAGAGRGQGDQDKEHKTAGYLVTLDNGNELIGKLPPVAPPVIGA